MNPDVRWLLWLDQRLSACRVISLEVLYFSPEAAAEQLCEALGLKFPTIGIPSCEIIDSQIPDEKLEEHRDTLTATSRPPRNFGGLAAYHEAMSAIIRQLTVSASDVLGPTVFVPDQIYRCASGQIGTLCLREGWSPPEEEFTWSDGNSSVILLPVPRDSVDPIRCCLRIQLTGQVACIPVCCKVLIGRNVLCTIQLTDKASHHLTIDAPLPEYFRRQGAGVITAELKFDRTLRLADDNPGADPRRLGIALRSIQIRLHTYSTTVSELRALLDIQPPRVAFSVGLMPSELTDDLLFMLEDLDSTQQFIRQLDKSQIDKNSLATSKHEANAIVLGPLNIDTRTYEPLGHLTLPPNVDLIILWKPEELGMLLQLLVSNVYSQSTPLPAIAIYRADPDIFNATWLTHRADFEKIIFWSNVTIGTTWTLFRLGRRQ